MSDDPTNPPATNPPATDPPATGPDQQKPADVAGVRAIVAETLNSLFKSGKAGVSDKTSSAAPAERDIAEEVRRAVTAARTEEERTSLMTTLATDVATLKAVTEKAPVQARKVETLMGWRSDDQ